MGQAESSYQKDQGVEEWIRRNCTHARDWVSLQPTRRPALPIPGPASPGVQRNKCCTCAPSTAASPALRTPSPHTSPHFSTLPADPCPCKPSYEYCGADGCATYTGCTEADSPGRPWCIVDTSNGAAAAPSPDAPAFSFYWLEEGGQVCHADGTITDLTNPDATEYYAYC